jgi:hypothetical protein
MPETEIPQEIEGLRSDGDSVDANDAKHSRVLILERSSAALPAVQAKSSMRSDYQSAAIRGDKARPGLSREDLTWLYLQFLDEILDSIDKCSGPRT